MKTKFLILACAVAQFFMFDSGGNGHVVGNTGKKNDLLAENTLGMQATFSGGTGTGATIGTLGGKKHDVSLSSDLYGDPIIQAGDRKKKDFANISYQFEGEPIKLSGKKEDFKPALQIASGGTGSTLVGGTIDLGKKKDYCNTEQQSGGTGVSSGGSTGTIGLGKKRDFA